VSNDTATEIVRLSDVERAVAAANDVDVPLDDDAIVCGWLEVRSGPFDSQVRELAQRTIRRRDGPP
jgi:hypothetical protein